MGRVRVRPRRLAIVAGVLIALPAAGVVVAGCGDEPAGGTAASTAVSTARSAAPAAVKYTAGQTVVAQLGTTFVVTLLEKPSTGYVWEAAGGSANGTRVTLVGVTEVPVPSGPDGPDAGGSVISREFTYNTTKAGSGTLRFEHKRPWEDAPISSKTFNVNVVR